LPPRFREAASSFHWSRLTPITCQLFGPSGPPGICSDMKATFFGTGRMPPVTPMTSEIWRGGFSISMWRKGSRLATCPASKHSCSGWMPSSFISVMNCSIKSKLFSNTALKTKPLRRREYLA
jgi:hypothetical protein